MQGFEAAWSRHGQTRQYSCVTRRVVFDQVQGFEAAWSRHGQTRQYLGFVHCLTSVAREQGVRGWYRGLSPSLIKAVLTTAISFSAYEQTINAAAALYASVT